MNIASYQETLSENLEQLVYSYSIYKYLHLRKNNKSYQVLNYIEVISLRDTLVRLRAFFDREKSFHKKTRNFRVSFEVLDKELYLTFCRNNKNIKETINKLVTHIDIENLDSSNFSGLDKEDEIDLEVAISDLKKIFLEINDLPANHFDLINVKVINEMKKLF